MPNASINRTARMGGNLHVVVQRGLPPHGLYTGPAGRWMGLSMLPLAQMAWMHITRSVWLEIMLHFRLAWTGLWRGFWKAEGVLGVGRLHATYRNGLTGELVPLGLVSTKVITDNGVTYLRDDFNNSAQDITNMNFHGAGTGTVAEAQTDSALGTESTTALNPDSTRATGTRSVPATNQFRSVGTLTYDADTAVTEHGILSQAATGGGTLWDRSKFAAINVVGANGDSIQFTYTLTLSAGG